MGIKTIERVAVSETPLVYRTTMNMIHIANILVILGVGLVSPSIVQYVTNAIYFFIGSFLVWRFHPIFTGRAWFWVDKHINSFEHSVVFSAGLIMIETVVLGTIFSQPAVQKYIQSEKNVVGKYVSGLLKNAGIKNWIYIIWSPF